MKTKQQQQQETAGFRHVRYVLVPERVALAIEKEQLEKEAAKEVEPERDIKRAFGLLAAQPAATRVPKAKPSQAALRGVPKKLRHPLYCVAQLEKLIEDNELRGAKSDKDRAKVRELYLALEERGGKRRLAAPPKDWRSRLVQLRVKHPNFIAVIDYLESEFGLAAAMKEAPRLAPMLLDGAPGAGKTLFAESLSQLMQTGFERFNFETAQTCSDLTGSDEHWSNSKVGRLFSHLTDSRFANPVMLIDEVDKAGGNGGYTVNSSLYSLLERGTASSWADLAYPRLKLNVSRVIWVLTSNNKWCIPSALRSRMRVFDIPALTTAQARDIAMQIFARVASEFREIGFCTALPLPMAAVMATASPREMQRMCRELIASAVGAGRRSVEQSDLNRMNLDVAELAAWSVVARQSADADQLAADWPTKIVKH